MLEILTVHIVVSLVEVICDKQIYQPIGPELQLCLSLSPVAFSFVALPSACLKTK